ncbi:MAG: hypothetical protein ABSB59_35750 [Streptosporangiaceae bacterium]
MTESVPIACTLTPAGLAGQTRRWRRLLAQALTARAATADGLRLRFRPEAEAELRALAGVEAGCCPWATWTIEAGGVEAGGEVILDVRAAAEGVAALHGMFRTVAG